MVLQHPDRSEFEAAEARRASFMSAIPPELLDAEDKLPAQVRSLNAASRTKLHRIYQVAEDLSRIREPFVACKKGCSSCCHMNVSITKAEAERLAKASGRSIARVAAAPRHARDKFAGKLARSLIRRALAPSMPKGHCPAGSTLPFSRAPLHATLG